MSDCAIYFVGQSRQSATLLKTQHGQELLLGHVLWFRKGYIKPPIRGLIRTALVLVGLLQITRYGLPIRKGEFNSQSTISPMVRTITHLRQTAKCRLLFFVKTLNRKKAEIWGWCTLSEMVQLWSFQVKIAGSIPFGTA